MHKNELFIVVLLILTGKLYADEHELIFNNDIVYYDECRISVSPRNYFQPVNAYAQIQKPCNGTLLWTHPNLHLTLTLVNLENDPFTLCYEKKPLDDNFIRSIKQIDLETNQTNSLREVNSGSGVLLCTSSKTNRLSTIIEAQPLYAGVYIRYGMFNERHPWSLGPYPGWERSEKYLYGPTVHESMKKKKTRRYRKKKIH